MGKRKGKPKAKTKASGETADALGRQNDHGTTKDSGPTESLENCDQEASNCRKLAQTFVSQTHPGSKQAFETKLVSKASSSTSNTTSKRPEDEFQRELREKLARVNGASNSPPPPPLISISIAPATAQPSRSASCASSTQSAWSVRSAKRQEAHVDEENSDYDDDDDDYDATITTRGEPQARTRVSSESSSCDVFDGGDKDSAKGAPSAKLYRNDQVDDDDLDDNNSNTGPQSGLELVKGSYIRLIRYNSLQYFYLGSLAYSVMEMIYFLSLVWINSSYVAKDMNADLKGTNPSLQHRNTSNLTSSSTICDNNYDLQLQQQQIDIRFSLIIMFPVTLLLVIVIVLKFYLEFIRLPAISKHKNKHQKPKQENVAAPRAAADANEMRIEQTKPHWISDRLLIHARPQHLKVVAILLSIWLLVFPIGHLHYYRPKQRQTKTVAGQHDDEDCTRVASHAPVHDTPVVLLGLIVYLLPHLISEIIVLRQKYKQLQCLLKTLLTFLPLAMVILWSRWHSSLGESFQQRNPHHIQLTLILVTCATLAGWRKLSLLKNLICESTFRGASDLIEAKVSLEQQRQQQETLLLSVLPAYVAEQVKRTMVKKMESFKDNDADALQTTPLDNNNQQQQVHLVSTANASSQTVHGPVHCARSLTMPAHGPQGVASDSAGGVEPQPLAAAGAHKAALVVSAAQSQRHSFAAASRLSSSLASGAAFISEALQLTANTIAANEATTSTNAVT